MPSYTLAVGEKKYRVPFDLMPQLVAEYTAEREIEPAKKWRKFVLYCTQCQRPCTTACACKCCGTTALNRHVQMLPVGEFLERAHAALLAGAA